MAALEENGQFEVRLGQWAAGLQSGLETGDGLLRSPDHAVGLPGLKEEILIVARQFHEAGEEFLGGGDFEASPEGARRIGQREGIVGLPPDCLPEEFEGRLKLVAAPAFARALELGRVQ